MSPLFYKQFKDDNNKSKVITIKNLRVTVNQMDKTQQSIIKLRPGDLLLVSTGEEISPEKIGVRGGERR